MNFLRKKKSKYSKLNDKEIFDLNDQVKTSDISININNVEDDYIIVECPHCFMKIMVYKKDFNSKIFRHGIYKNTGKQIDSHMKKEMCDKLVNENKIYGCGKPYKLNVIKSDNSELYFTEICDYI